MALAKFNGGSGFFKAAEHIDAEAILFEPVRVEYGVPSQFGPQDVLHANVTVFGADGPQVFAGAKVTGKALINDLGGYLNQQVAATVALVPNKKGGKDFPVLRPATPGAEKKVEEYLEERDAALESAPDFLK